MKKIYHYIVVDDDPTNNMICEFTIKRYDKQAHIKLFTKPEEALSFIEQDYAATGEEICTVLFLDVNMPTMTGWEFLDAFNKMKESLKKKFIIYILSSSIEDFRKEAEIYPMLSGFLSKPLKLDIIEGIMTELQEGRS